ncbi:MAG: TonB family protein [Pyrinomonadaceae bacterium]|nr:TonB family protein [Pyrinomonadaceae bacterium]
MLDQLVESRNTGSENRRRGGFLVTVGVLIFSLAIIGLLSSLFAQNLTVGGDGLELSTLIAPVPLPEEAPPPPDEPEPEKKVKQDDPKVDVRKQIIANINESPTKPPKEIKVTKADIPARRLGRTTVIGTSNSDGAAASSGPTRTVSGDGGGGIATTTVVATPEPKKAAPPPPPPPPPKPTPKPVPKRISGGVVNGKAISLPKPPYPAAARAVRAAGSVSVSVVISKTGSVMSASASGGHPLLRAAAVSAARRARFRPTMLSGQPVEVSGVIVYNFRP